MQAINRYLLIIPALFMFSFTAVAQDSAAVARDTERSLIRSLSDRGYLDLKYGREMGMADVAAVNRYPVPDQVKQLAGELKLSASQKTELEKILAAREFKAREMGGFILAQETRLNGLFESGKATDGSVIYYTNKIGLYLGELRNAHLQAYLKTRKILTAEQIRRYYQIKAATK